MAIYFYVLDHRAILKIDQEQFSFTDTEEAQRLFDLFQQNQITIQDIRNRNKITFNNVSKTVEEWAQYLAISRNAIYKRAKLNNRTPAEEIEYRLKARRLLP